MLLTNVAFRSLVLVFMICLYERDFACCLVLIYLNFIDLFLYWFGALMILLVLLFYALVFVVLIVCSMFDCLLGWFRCFIWLVLCCFVGFAWLMCCFGAYLACLFRFV